MLSLPSSLLPLQQPFQQKRLTFQLKLLVLVLLQLKLFLLVLLALTTNANTPPLQFIIMLVMKLMLKFFVPNQLLTQTHTNILMKPQTESAINLKVKWKKLVTKKVLSSKVNTHTPVQMVNITESLMLLMKMASNHKPLICHTHKLWTNDPLNCFIVDYCNILSKYTINYNKH